MILRLCSATFLFFALHSLSAMDSSSEESAQKVIIPKLKTRRSGSIILGNPGQPETPRFPSTARSPRLVLSKNTLSAPTTSRREDRKTDTSHSRQEEDESRMIQRLGLSPRAQKSFPEQKGYMSPLSPRCRSTSSNERDMLSGSDDEQEILDNKCKIITPTQLYQSELQRIHDKIKKYQITKDGYQKRVQEIDSKIAALIEELVTYK